MKAGNVRLEHFEIQTETGGATTKALYANGRHQCKLVVLITKIIEDELGNPQFKELTAAERNSLTVTRYSPTPGVPLPAGWYCDTEKNIYDSGLWSRGGSKREKVDFFSVAAKPPLTNRPLEMLERYMRVDATQPIQIQRFMARIQVAGKVYTTNYTDEDSSFHSWVEIQPERPYVLRVADLVRYIDTKAYEDKVNRISVYVHYWRPPQGIIFFQNLGITNPLSVKNEGRLFKTSDISIGGVDRKAGILVGRDSFEQPLFMADVQQGIYQGDGPEIEYRRHFTVMRAIMLQGGVPPTADRDTGHWTLLDNFGCEHRYRLELNWTSDLKLTD